MFHFDVLSFNACYFSITSTKLLKLYFNNFRSFQFFSCKCFYQYYSFNFKQFNGCSVNFFTRGVWKMSEEAL